MTKQEKIKLIKTLINLIFDDEYKDGPVIIGDKNEVDKNILDYDLFILIGDNNIIKK